MSLKRDDWGNWILYFRVGGRGSEEVRRNFGKVAHADAKTLARELETKLKRTPAGAQPFLTFGELAKTYLEERRDRLTPKGYALAEMIVRCHLAPFFGARRVMDLRAADVEAYRAQRRRWAGKKEKHATEHHVSNGTFNREWSLLRAILGFGERTERIERNPIRRGAVEKLATTPREAFFEPEEWKTFLAGGAGDVELRAAVPILRAKLLLAARIGEIVDLRWRDVDLERHLVTVRQPKVSKREPRPKVLPIVAELEAILRGQVRGFGEAFVFLKYDGKPWRVADLQTAFARMLRLSALAPAHGHLTPHSIRHTAATWAARAGFKARAGDLLGHTAKGSTAVYMHTEPADLKPTIRALAKIESGFGAEVVRNLTATGDAAPEAKS